MPATTNELKEHVMPSEQGSLADVDPAVALRGILALLITEGDGLKPSQQRTELVLAATGLGTEQIASLRALVNNAAAAGSSAREESVIDRARATLVARSQS
jgi:hypothetical protein